MSQEQNNDQGSVQTQEQQQVQLGFEKALNMLDPQWRDNISKKDVNHFRHFYHQGLQDLNFLVRASAANMEQNVQTLLNQLVVTGNEDEIARLRAEAEAKQAAEKAQADAQAPVSEVPVVDVEAVAVPDEAPADPESAPADEQPVVEVEAMSAEVDAEPDPIQK